MSANDPSSPSGRLSCGPRSSLLRRWVSPAGSVIMLGMAAWIVRRHLTHLAWSDVAAAWAHIPRSRIAGSVAATALSFSMLALFDVLATRIAVRGRVSTALAAFAGAVTQGISNTLGFHAFTGSAVRYRIYASAGLTAGAIARVVALAGLGVGLGFAVVITGALCWQPAATHGWGRLPGALMLALLAGLLGWLARRPRALTLWGWTLAFPDAATATMQMLVGGVEMLAAVAALYVLLPAGIAPPFVDFLPLYVGAVVAGIVSHAPGGLGVFETIMLAAFPPAARAELLAAMLCYRLTYSLLPFTLASLALGAFELRLRRSPA